MRVNVYAEEMTDRIQVIAKEIEGQRFTGLRFYLELPVTVAERQYRGPFIHHPGDDDSAAVTFWGKRDLRSVLRTAIGALDAHYEGKAAETTSTPASNGLRVGTSLHDGEPVELILLPGEFKGPWQKAQAWAEEHGGSLPSRIDMLVLLQRCRGEFQSDWYWTDEQSAGAAEFAWCQGFYHGDQGDDRKLSQLRARAVRRVPIR